MRLGIIGDTHAPVCLEAYPGWCADVFEAWGVDKIVHIGDLADWHACSRHESELGFSDPIDEFAKARKQIQQMQAIFGPKVEVLLGNHDAVPQRTLKSIGIPMHLLRNPHDIWEVEWKFHPRYTKLRIDDFQLMHGDQGRSGKLPALSKAEDDWTSTVCGHYHSNAGVWYGANENSRYWGMCVGCGVDAEAIQMSYAIPYSKKPMLGCGVVIEGTPYFEPMPLKNKFGRKLR